MQNFRNILVAVDMHEHADDGPLIAQALATARSTGARVRFVTVADLDLDSAMVDRFDEIKSSYAAVLAERLNAMIEKQDVEGVDYTAHVSTGRAHSAILAVADEVGADLIMLSAHRPSARDFLLGSTAARVARHSETSVLVVRPPRTGT